MAPPVRSARPGADAGALLVSEHIIYIVGMPTPSPAHTTLAGRTVLITGAARGIGAAVARRLAAAHCRLVLADIDGPAVEKLAAELDGAAVRADVTREADIAAMVDVAYQRWGRLDVLFNNAGVIRVQPLLEVTRAEWDRVLDVNLRAVFFVLQAAARRMVEQPPIPGSELRGKLIQTASIAAYRGASPLVGPYAASKAGVVSITRTAAQALASHRITANCVCPGAVDTAMWAQIDREQGTLEGRAPGETWKRRIAGVPLGRGETVDDVAGVVTFLAGPDSDYMTWQAINVDGGLVMGN
jgi:NAD(P)-dependent dehydrogenase (short-subunit alcohol dehydrogenase family)